MSSSTASVAAYIASIGSSTPARSAVNRSEPPCARASGATIRYDDPNRDEVGEALTGVGDPVQEQQNRFPGIAVLVTSSRPTRRCEPRTPACHRTGRGLSRGDGFHGPVGKLALPVQNFAREVTGIPRDRGKPPIVQTGRCARKIATTDRVGREAARVRPAAPQRHPRDHAQERQAAGLAGHRRRRRAGPDRRLDVPRSARRSRTCDVTRRSRC